MKDQREPSEEGFPRALHLPPVGQTGVILLDLASELPKEIASPEVLEVIRKARMAGKPVWVIIG